ncbi:MAG: UvrD-helicase domain-containing protein [bacterium]
MSTCLDTLNPEQKKAVTYENGPLLIVAGAGTGKTTVITKRIAWLIEEKKASGDEILALTFTDKSAGEMEERVDYLLPYGYFDLWISTFHSFCDRILRDYALDIGLPTNYKLLNTTEQWMLIRKNLDRFNLDYYRPFGNPTKFIHALLKHFSRCKDEGISVEEYLEYAESVRLNQDNAESGGDSSKFKVQSSKLKTDPHSAIAQGRLSATCLRPACAGGRQALGMTNDRVADALEFKKLEEVANAYHIYQQILLENDALDFGDLIQCTLKLFKERPNILKILRDKFKYILVDEFQDTNWAQYELIKLISAPLNNITCVADDDQSIYLFRGSSVNNVLQFAKDYPKAEEVVLTQNYRSKQDILDLSYEFIQQNNPNRLEYHLNQDEVMRERAKEKGIDLKDYKNINKKLKAFNFGKAIIEHLHCGTLEDEVEAVVNKIVETHCNASLSWSDFSILVRANDTAKPFINGLERAGIPYQFYSMRGLYNKPIILDICAYLKLLDNYHESTALYRILNIPMWRIPYDDFSKLSHASSKNGKSLYQTIKNAVVISGLSPATVETLSNIIVLVEKYSSLAKENKISKILTDFLNDSGYLKYLVKNESKDNIKALKYISQFYKKVKEFEESEIDPKLNVFMEKLEMEMDAGDEGELCLDPDDGPDMVKIMTIHSAKGLEFPYVFIVDLVDKKFPTIERKDPIEIPEQLVKEILPEGDIHLQEERRLFYVAMTRAKDGLFFTSAEDYGGIRKKKISRFLTEMGYVSSAGVQNFKLVHTEENFNVENNDNKFLYTLPQKFSYTQLAAFDKCPLQYKFAHIFKIQIKGKGNFSFGKTMHTALQRFFALMNERKGSKQCGLFENTEYAAGINLPTKDELLKIYDECWIDEWYEDDKQRDERRKAGRESLKEFYELHKDNWPNVLYLEQGFNLRVGGYTLKGTIDRVDLLNAGGGQNSVEIVDYKTGASKDVKSLTFENKEQLFIYQLVAEEFFKMKCDKLSFYYLEGNKKAEFLGSPKDLEKLKEKILERIEKIKSSNFAPTPGFWCENCDYRDICEHRS